MSRRHPTRRASTGTGTPASIGAGIYRRDLPGTCRREEVNATQLDEHPSNQRLQEFVRCAAMELETARLLEFRLDKIRRDFTLKLDRSDAKITLANINKGVCSVLATWQLDSRV